MDKVDHKTPEEIYEALGFNNKMLNDRIKLKKLLMMCFILSV